MSREIAKLPLWGSLAFFWKGGEKNEKVVFDNDVQGLKDDSLYFHFTFQKEDLAWREDVDQIGEVSAITIEVIKNAGKI